MATNYGNLKQVQWWKTNQEIRCWCMWIITCKGTISLMYTFCSLWRLLRHKYHWKLMLKSPKPDLSIKLCSRHQHNSKKRTICFQCNVNWLLFWAHLVMKWGWLITLGGNEYRSQRSFFSCRKGRSNHWNSCHVFISNAFRVQREVSGYEDITATSTIIK